MNNLIISSALVAVMAQPAVAAASLCQEAERAFFTCTLKGSTKQLSLCGSKQLTSKSGYLQYRFGRLGSVELEFPKERTNSLNKFRFAHYFRFQVDRTEVSFKKDAYSYTVRSYYEGEVTPATTEFGVAVQREGEEARTLACDTPEVNELLSLESIIPCDEDNALSMGCKPTNLRPTLPLQ